VTYVLVHGGGSSSRYWDRVVPLLDGPVLAVDLPGRGAHPAELGSITVDDEVASVVSDIDNAAITDPIVLVAHSSGGLVVPGVVAALGRKRFERIVLNAALVPSEGGCGLEGMQPRHAEGLAAAVAASEEPITLPGEPGDPERTRVSYGGDPLSDDDIAFVTDPCRLVADTVHHYFQPVHWSKARGIPVTYIVNDRDRPIPTPLQLEMIERLPDPPHVVHLDSGHIPAITMPEAFVAALRA
jgi:pimeloyl-ACP methyl ester carboxylesterase